MLRASNSKPRTIQTKIYHAEQKSIIPGHAKKIKILPHKPQELNVKIEPCGLQLEGAAEHEYYYETNTRRYDSSEVQKMLMSLSYKVNEVILCTTRARILCASLELMMELDGCMEVFDPNDWIPKSMIERPLPFPSVECATGTFLRFRMKSMIGFDEDNEAVNISMAKYARDIDKLFAVYKKMTIFAVCNMYKLVRQNLNTEAYFEPPKVDVIDIKIKENIIRHYCVALRKMVDKNFKIDEEAFKNISIEVKDFYYDLAKYYHMIVINDRVLNHREKFMDFLHGTISPEETNSSEIAEVAAVFTHYKNLLCYQYVFSVSFDPELGEQLTEHLDYVSLAFEYVTQSLYSTFGTDTVKQALVHAVRDKAAIENATSSENTSTDEKDHSDR